MKTTLATSHTLTPNYLSKETYNMKEATNEFRITGTLKSKDLKEGTTKSGKAAIMGNLVVEVNDGRQIHNHRIDMFTFRDKKDGSHNKIYDSYKTVMDEYKDSDTYQSEADVVTVNGSVEYNVYEGKNGTSENMRFRGLFANRVAKDAPQEAFANIDMVIDGFTPEMKNDEPTGMHKVSAYSVGYNDRGIKLVGMVVDDNLGVHEQITPGTTIKGTVKLNNYAIVKKEEKPAENALFGTTKSVVENNSFVRNLQLVGGAMGSTQYAPEELDAMKKSVKEQISEAQANTSKGGFGTQAAPVDTSAIDDKLPF